MKALIIGKGGQVATELARRVPDGSDFVVLGRPEIDLTYPAGCAEAVSGADVDVVINAAAYTAVDKAESDEATAMNLNAEVPEAMAQAARDVGAT